tara:strand:- start:729 stop:935 length:207 start_codon:yes stop_codon:yes gene_type:complete
VEHSTLGVDPAYAILLAAADVVAADHRLVAAGRCGGKWWISAKHTFTKRTVFCCEDGQTKTRANPTHK